MKSKTLSDYSNSYDVLLENIMSIYTQFYSEKKIKGVRVCVSNIS